MKRIFWLVAVLVLSLVSGCLEYVPGPLHPYGEDACPVHNVHQPYQMCK
jgi:hypothetical protein